MSTDPRARPEICLCLSSPWTFSRQERRPPRQQTRGNSQFRLLTYCNFTVLICEFSQFENIQSVILGCPSFAYGEEENLEKIFEQWHDHYDPTQDE